MLRVFNQCLRSLLEPCVLPIRKGYLAVFLYIICLKSINLFILYPGNTPSKLLFKSSALIFFYCLFYLKIQYSFKHFGSYKVCFVLFVLRNLLSPIQELFKLFCDISSWLLLDKYSVFVLFLLDIFLSKSWFKKLIADI